MNFSNWATADIALERDEGGRRGVLRFFVDRFVSSAITSFPRAYRPRRGDLSYIAPPPYCADMPIDRHVAMVLSLRRAFPALRRRHRSPRCCVAVADLSPTAASARKPRHRLNVLNIRARRCVPLAHPFIPA